jgi:hypothetical protein
MYLLVDGCDRPPEVAALYIQGAAKFVVDGCELEDRSMEPRMSSIRRNKKPQDEWPSDVGERPPAPAACTRERERRIFDF